ncbi:3-phosphoshikimate 1-carboxyvinyltransferase [Hanstruepera flava]|uniref:3-phosphoshikimate 1-carboxyvinyltransferase n=1 Tax=Hanstruepera flava TaxID=2930218 RepID=UPI0020282A26|nr:3-phosphoshikimate 1-carboxyvinyltransferase [Hanstruepera flava]
MTIKLQKSELSNLDTTIAITGSKSESNRLLLLQALFPNLKINNLSNSDDSKVMQKALGVKNPKEVDVHHAGTAMRFLTAYFSTQQGQEVVLTGSSRMKERPIKILVDALVQLGADISYLENIGFPPLRINGKALTKRQVNLQANVSSQYISALLLIGSQLKNGIELTLEGKITSVPYIKMTLSLLDQLGIETLFSNNTIIVKPKSKIEDTLITVESDWSSASYYFSLIALSEINAQVALISYRQNSLQGDSRLTKIYEHFGVVSNIKNNKLVLRKVANIDNTSRIVLDLSDAPDIAQTIAVTCFGLGLSCELTGLHTLKIKETDRLLALKTELEKLGANVNANESSLLLHSTKPIKSNVFIDTYNDHRMAMAFAPLALKTDININDAAVVSKSYPSFWDDMNTLGIKVSE